MAKRLTTNRREVVNGCSTDEDGIKNKIAQPELDAILLLARALLHLHHSRLTPTHTTATPLRARPPSHSSGACVFRTAALSV